MENTTFYYQVKDGINDNTGAVKKIRINFSRVNTKFYLNLHCNSDESYLYGNRTDICKFKAHENMSWYNFFQGAYQKFYAKDEQSEIL